MSCLREHEVLELETEWVAEGRHAAILAHVSECARCAKTAERLAEARAELRLRSARAIGPMRAGERRAIAVALRAEVRPAFKVSIAFWVAAAAAAAFIFVVATSLWRTTSPLDPAAKTVGRAVIAAVPRGDLFPRGQKVILPERASFELAEGAVRSISCSALELDREVLHIHSGELEIAVEERGLITVLTPAIAIDGVGALFRVDVEEERTTVFIERGMVVLDEHLVFSAGESVTVAREQTSHAAIAVPPAQKPAQKTAQKTAKHLHTEPPGAPPSVADVPEVRPELAEAERAEPGRAEPGRAEPGREDPPPGPKRDFQAILKEGDAARRAGRLRVALDLYTEVAEDPLENAFREEAMLRRATLLDVLGNAGEALAALDAIAYHFPNGELAPERALLAAKIHLAHNDPLSAATELEKLDDRTTLQILRARIDVARALAVRQPNRALALLRPALAPSAPDEVRDAASNLEVEIRRREKN